MALHTAVQQNQLEQVEQLLDDAGVDVNEVDAAGCTPLFLAAVIGSLNIVQALLAAGPDVDATTDGYTPLHLAAQRGHHQVVQMLLAAGSTIAGKLPEGWSPLHAAAYGGHTQVVQLLLAQGASVDSVDNSNGVTPLHVAAATGQHEVVQLLLAAGANIDAVDLEGQSALHHAARPLLGPATAQGKLEVAAALLRWGADPHLRNIGHGTALLTAAEAGDTAMVKLLIEAWGKPGVPAARLVFAAQAAALGQHMAAFVCLVMELRRLWPAELPKLFVGEFPVSEAQAVAAVITEWDQDAISLDGERAALRQSQENAVREKVALQRLECDIIVHVARMRVTAQGQLDDAPVRGPTRGLWAMLKQQVRHLWGTIYRSFWQNRQAEV